MIDASVALAWCFPDEASEYADAVLATVETQQIVVPAIWPLEITNALLVGERRKRLRQFEIRRFIELLKGLNLVEDSQPMVVAFTNVLPLAREHGITAYDAAYVDVALRREASLATLDAALQRAARDAGVTIVKF